MELLRELGRKTFHMLSLAYLVAYRLLGYPRVVRWMIPWSVFVLIVETARLYVPAFNGFLFSLLGSLSRDYEKTHYSGIVHTTVGAFLLFLAFRDKTPYIDVGLYCVAFGDAGAALVGKWLGRHRLFNSKKTVEGSLACFLICAAAGAGSGFSAGCALMGALAGTIIEWLPTNALFNDNMWMPICVAGAIRLCAG